MNRNAIFFTVIVLFITLNAKSQCDSISLIGEFSDWVSDSVMVPDEIDSSLCSLAITFTIDDDSNDDEIIEVKFRKTGDWAYNWGGLDFPSGIGIESGPNIPVPFGSYIVYFNCVTHAYDFSPDVGIEDAIFQTSILYPVPVINTLHISNASQISKAEIYSLIGKKILLVDNERKQEIAINTSGLNSGIYFLKLESKSGQTSTRKFVKN
jgi:hypothetical protein